MKSYRVDFRVQGYTELEFTGAVSENIEIRDAQRGSYVFGMYVNASNEDEAGKQAADTFTTYLNSLALCMNAPMRTDPKGQIDVFEKVGDQFKPQSHHVTLRTLAKVKEKESLLKSANHLYGIAIKTRYLRIALDFYNRSMWEEYKDNKLISAFVAFEALYTGGQRTELSYRLSHRVATLLGEYDKGRKDIFDRMRTLYDKRSSLMHGTDVRIEDADIVDSLRYLRESLNRFVVIASRFSKEQILEMIDEAIVDKDKHSELQKLVSSTEN